ncbi:aldehyde dehydrogenase family protein [Burkholderia thailandensis USAMRU Malaysia |uniref:Aldehyde dehydrogenase n=1 Tax=Burkholderia thailandensis (strain ATCC 700388 / DSM 13276 / CCUG 48851 / CIP 106301 / E264) TaxID=271848 RepID=Q2T249_BURTA|nr:coniferyl aldehyde dehydrogenase [Burkholderia thailandensis]ABC38997.1 coniferyl aldehyde dehydrogenase [Burkholderia thailandensis E264]AHI74538.1 aldehyde dehydrogenase family protein [Burkholderia thailandensis 2002721723]AHI78223.1 aldehyde dehydrogenase family protein [Burkholderia thailandensis E444]AIC88539.1 aldehyde dehydrogenase family protein [Burkholderia thailandensis USAMRU Malaysia \
MKNDLPGLATLDALLRDQRAAYLRAPYPSWATRADHLRALRKMLLDNRDALAAAIDADFGHRAKEEVLMSEIWLAKEEIDEALKHGKRWIKPKSRAMNKWMRPARAKVMPQPLGVVGIVVPWNYPVLLAAGPLICALAAGNRAIIKMSELTPRTSQLFEELISKTFARDHVAVVNGDAEISAAFSGLPFDHLLFTGSTNVGRHVMRAAAENLTPVTLELGGKSPVIIGPRARFDAAVDAIITGKTLNAGQTCIAPDYVLVPRGKEAEFVARARARMAKLYPNLSTNPDYTSIISERHFARLQRLASDAQQAGAQLHPLTDAAPDPALRRLPPVLVTQAPDASQLMQEEIFGPLLPIVPYDTLDDAIAYVNARARPLALYLFDEDRSSVERVMRDTISGGVTVNDTLMHIACGTLPFGGVGASGMGAYHGYDGFVTFSKMKPVLTQPRLNTRAMIAPPYGKRFAAILKLMLKF